MQFITYYESSIGRITLSSDGDNLCGLWFDKQKYDRLGLYKDATYDSSLMIFKMVNQYLDDYFKGLNPTITIPIKFNTTPFREQVFSHLLTIPYGTTTTYKKIAQDIALENGIKSMSAQAVGSAIGHNPITIIVPCHRVIGTDGSLTGFTGGIERKEFFLNLEKGHSNN